MRQGEVKQFRYSDGVVFRWYNRKTAVWIDGDYIFIEFWRPYRDADVESDHVKTWRKKVTATQICISIESARFLSVALLETLKIKK